MSKVLITTSSFSLGNFAEAKALHDAGISIEMNPHGRRLSEDEVAGLVEFPSLSGALSFKTWPRGHFWYRGLLR